MTKNNSLKSYSIESKTSDLRELEYEENKLSYNLSSLKNLNDDFIRNTFIGLCKNYNGTVESMVKIQGQLNDIIADINNSVNKNKQQFIIKR